MAKQRATRGPAARTRRQYSTGDAELDRRLSALVEELELALGKVGIHHRQRNAVKSQIPCGKPGVFPIIRHREDIFGIEVFPSAVSAVSMLFWRRTCGQ